VIDVGALQERWSVGSVLDVFGVPHSHGRAACPVCGGRNRQAFSFGNKAAKGWREKKSGDPLARAAAFVRYPSCVLS
jgi:phage/plasmid primase-like uncharacterized protein